MVHDFQWTEKTLTMDQTDIEVFGCDPEWLWRVYICSKCGRHAALISGWTLEQWREQFGDLTDAPCRVS